MSNTDQTGTPIFDQLLAELTAGSGAAARPEATGERAAPVEDAKAETPARRTSLV